MSLLSIVFILVANILLTGVFLYIQAKEEGLDFFLLKQKIRQRGQVKGN